MYMIILLYTSVSFNQWQNSWNKVSLIICLLLHRCIWAFNNISVYYIDTDEIPGFFLLPKNHTFIARREETIFFFYVWGYWCRHRLIWLANYKRASRSGARPVLLKFHSQNGFEVQRRYSYRWPSRWAAKFSYRKKWSKESRSWPEA